MDQQPGASSRPRDRDRDRARRLTWLAAAAATAVTGAGAGIAAVTIPGHTVAQAQTVPAAPNGGDQSGSQGTGDLGGGSSPSPVQTPQLGTGRSGHIVSGGS